MNTEEYKLLFNSDRDSFIRVSDLNNKSDRTLIYGYSIDTGDTFHLFLLDKIFHVMVYNQSSVAESWYSDEIHPTTLPSKRAYPETCDYEYCNLVINRHGVNIPFTKWDKSRRPETFYGRIC